MKYVRIIPRLDIKGPNLVKGIHLEGLKILGSPDKFSEHYYKSGADELLYMDVGKLTSNIFISHTLIYNNICLY